jgi:hypothetical protein
MSRANVSCPLCDKQMRRDTLFRHCKSAHAEMMAKRMSNEPGMVEHVRKHQHTVLKCKATQYASIAVCAVCGKGATTARAEIECTSAEEFFRSHTECRTKWATVSWLWGVGQKPKPKKRGVAKPGAEPKPSKPEPPTVSLAPLIVETFPELFEYYDYETNDDEEEEDIEDKQEERQKLRAMTDADMIAQVAKYYYKQRKTIEENDAKTRKRILDATRQKDIEIDNMEQELFKKREEYERKDERIKCMQIGVESLVAERQRMENELVRLRQKLEEHGIPLTDE